MSTCSDVTKNFCTLCTFVLHLVLYPTTSTLVTLVTHNYGRCFAEVTNFRNFPMLHYERIRIPPIHDTTVLTFPRPSHYLFFAQNIQKFSFPTTSTKGDPMVTSNSNSNDNNNPNSHGHITRESIRNSVLAGYVAGKSVSNQHCISYMKQQS